MTKNWKDLTDDELLNFDEDHTPKMYQYDRIMSHKNIVAINSLRDKVTGLMETIYRASQGTQKKTDAIVMLFEKSSKSQNKQQKIIIALTIVIAISTIAYTWITFESVSAIRQSNEIQIQMLELEKGKLKIEKKPISLSDAQLNEITLYGNFTGSAYVGRVFNKNKDIIITQITIEAVPKGDNNPFNKFSPKFFNINLVLSPRAMSSGFEIDTGALNPEFHIAKIYEAKGYKE